MLTLLDEPERRIIRLAIPLFQSDLPFRIAFPVFLQNVVEWVNPSAQESVPHPVQPGRLPAAVLKAWNEGEALTLAQPSGEVHHLESGDRELSREAHTWVLEPGVYRWWAESGEGSFAVSLLDREESNLNSRWTEALIQGGATFLNLDRDRLADLVPEASIRRDAPAASQTERLWRWIGLLSIILLLLEGRLYTAPAGGARCRARAVERSAHGCSWPGTQGKRRTETIERRPAAVALGITFSSPWWLLAAIAIPYAWWMWRRYSRLLGVPPSHRFLPAFRGLALAFLVLAVAGATLRTPLAGVDLYVLFDGSASIAAVDQRKARDVVDTLATLLGPDDRMNLFMFGRDVVSLGAYQEGLEPSAALSQASVDPSATRLAYALEGVFQRLPARATPVC